MGLDTVEFILGIEDEYSIRISDAEAEELAKVGDLAQFIVGKVKKEHGKILEEGKVLDEIIRRLVNDHAVDRDTITPDSNFVRDLGLD